MWQLRPVNWIANSWRCGAVVSGLGSTWTTVGSLDVGVYSVASIDVAEGATLTSQVARLGIMGALPSGAIGDGTITVSDTRSIWRNTDSVIVGGPSHVEGGFGEINVHEDGLMLNGGALRIEKQGRVDVSAADMFADSIELEDGRLYGSRTGTFRIVHDLTGRSAPLMAKQATLKTPISCSIVLPIIRLTSVLKIEGQRFQAIWTTCPGDHFGFRPARCWSCETRMRFLEPRFT